MLLLFPRTSYFVGGHYGNEEAVAASERDPNFGEGGLLHENGDSRNKDALQRAAPGVPNRDFQGAGPASPEQLWVGATVRDNKFSGGVLRGQ